MFSKLERYFRENLQEWCKYLCYHKVTEDNRPIHITLFSLRRSYKYVRSVLLVLQCDRVRASTPTAEPFVSDISAWTAERFAEVVITI
jgi:hypothetical protein